MGLSYATLKNISNKFNEYPSGCVLCKENYKPGNPGTFEDIHKKFDNIETNHFEGAKIVLKTILSNHFYVSHTISMTPKAVTLYKPSLNQKDVSLDKLPIKNRLTKCENNDGYKLGVSYTGLKKINKERYPSIYADINSTGDVVANFSHTIGCRLRVKLDTVIKKSSYKYLKATADYRTDSCTITATLVDPSILQLDGVLILQYLQSITTRITMGIEAAINNTSSSLREKRTNIAGALRYSNGFQTLTATVGESALRVCYHHKQSPHLQMGAEFQSNFVRNESKGKILYKVAPTTYDIVFTGFVDSNFLIGAVLEKKLYPIPEASLILSGLFDHKKSNISVGIGLTIEK